MLIEFFSPLKALSEKGFMHSPDLFFKKDLAGKISRLSLPPVTQKAYWFTSYKASKAEEFFKEFQEQKRAKGKFLKKIW